VVGVGDADPSLELAPVPEAVGDARRFVRGAIGDVDGLEVPVDALVLAVSELVTNAIIHARTPFSVTVRHLQPGSVQIDVFDGNTRLPQSARVSRDATSGRGLAIIETLRLRWGVEPHPHGKTVWVRTP
jgi:anti-sigma regulatory factor (Ser/Thr protein kinase)